MEIQHEQFQNGGSFFVGASSDAAIAEMTYRRIGPVRFVDHTWVDDVLRGQGVARKLLDALVADVRATHEQIIPLCPYVKSQFEKDARLSDVLAALPRTIADGA